MIHGSLLGEAAYKQKHLFFTLGRSLCEKEYLWKIVKIWGFFLEVFFKWIPISLVLRYRSRKQNPHNVTTRPHTDKYIP